MKDWLYVSTEGPQAVCLKCKMIRPLSADEVALIKTIHMAGEPCRDDRPGCVRCKRPMGFRNVTITVEFPDKPRKNARGPAVGPAKRPTNSQDISMAYEALAIPAGSPASLFLLAFSWAPRGHVLDASRDVWAPRGPLSHVKRRACCLPVTTEATICFNVGPTLEAACLTPSTSNCLPSSKRRSSPR